MGGVTAWVIAAIALAGPPALPPLPGRSPAEPEPPPPAKPSAPDPGPSAPGARPLPSRAAPPPSRPSPPPPASPSPGPAPGAASTPTAGAVGSGPATPGFPPPPPSGVPTAPGPPQPDAVSGPSADSGPPPAAESPPPLRPPEGALLPGDEDEPREPARPRLPPPKRPPYGGAGLFAAAGVTFAVALAEQIVAHELVKRRCIRPVAAQAAMDSESDPIEVDPDDPPDEVDLGGETEPIGDLIVECIPGVVPAIPLRVHSDIGLLATIGLSAAAGIVRGRRSAWDSVFGEVAPKERAGLRVAGIALIGTGVVTWFSTGAASWGWLSSCETARCASGARLMNFLTRDASALMVASGAAMLGFAEAHRKSRASFERDKALTFGVGPLRGGGSLRLAGRF